MSISVECRCSRTFRIKDELAGKKVRCPDCKSILNVPEPEREPLTTKATKTNALQPESPPEPAPFRKALPLKLPDEYAPSRTKSTYESNSIPQAKSRTRKSRS